MIQNIYVIYFYRLKLFYVQILIVCKTTDNLKIIQTLYADKVSRIFQKLIILIIYVMLSRVNHIIT